jgi:hypothetical protein
MHREIPADARSREQLNVTARSLVRRNSSAISPADQRRNQDEDDMTSRTVKFLSVAVTAAALIATVAVARTVHTHAALTHASRDSAGATTGQMTPAPLHGIIACGMMNYSDCEKIEMLLPR